jgi:hypothetical protein
MGIEPGHSPSKPHALTERQHSLHYTDATLRYEATQPAPPVTQGIVRIGFPRDASANRPKKNACNYVVTGRTVETTATVAHFNETSS